MTGELARDAAEILGRVGVASEAFRRGAAKSRSPITGESIGRPQFDDAESASAAVADAENAFRVWRKIPAPSRGAFVRLLAEELRTARSELARLVTLEAGKISSESLGGIRQHAIFKRAFANLSSACELRVDLGPSP